MTFDEHDHPRHGDGTFAEKDRTTPEIALSPLRETTADVLKRYDDAADAYEEACNGPEGDASADEYEDYEDSMMSVVGDLAEEVRKRVIPAEVRERIDAKLDELGMADAMLLVPEDGFADGYIDVVAYDGAEGRFAKFTISPDGDLDVYGP